MSLSANQLDAFHEIALTSSFTLAAKRLRVTQSALSQRVLNLEEELGTALVIRERAGLRLTEAGEKLLRYCQSRQGMEAELLQELAGKKSELVGPLRIGGYSTLNRSVVLPALAPWLRKHPGITLSLISRELRDLPSLLRSSAADFVFLNEPIDSDVIECTRVGFENYVLVRSATRACPDDVYLDHDPEDRTTERFLRLQGRKSTRFRRVYLGDIHAILTGVREGLGQAVIPEHLLRSSRDLKPAQGLQPLREPVYVCRYVTPYLPAVQREALATLLKAVPERL